MSVIGTYTLDGVALDDPAARWSLSNATLLRPLAAARGVSIKVPGRSGILPVVAGTFEVGAVTLGLTVTDNDDAGVPRGHAQVLANVDILQALVGQRQRMGRLEYTAPEAAFTRYADVELVAAVAPALHDNYTVGLVWPFEVPGVYWRDPAEAVLDVASFATQATLTPTELAGSTAPILDPTVLFAGPLSMARITDLTTGSLLEWRGSLTAGQYLRIEADAVAAYVTTAAEWTGGTDVSGGLSTGPTTFALTPDPVTRVVKFRLDRANGSGLAMVRARRAYL